MRNKRTPTYNHSISFMLLAHTSGGIQNGKITVSGICFDGTVSYMWFDGIFVHVALRHLMFIMPCLLLVAQNGLQPLPFLLFLYHAQLSAATPTRNRWVGFPEFSGSLYPGGGFRRFVFNSLGT